MTDTVVDKLAARFRELGVERIFGVPGGGSSLDLIEAAGRIGIDFILCRTETAAALMASVGAELTDVPGVVLTGIGPSAASVVNGVAYASLERAPLIVVTDTDERDDRLPPHQVFDQQAMFAPLTKASLRLDAENIGTDLDQLLRSTLVDPRGPVHLDLSTQNARAHVCALTDSPDPGPQHDIADTTNSLAEIAGMLANSHRPVIIVGLQARRTGISEKLHQLVERLGCPVLVSYKAKGVIAENNPRFVGIFTGATAEGDTLSRADLILTLGLDPVEMIPLPWTYDAPVCVVMQGMSDAFSFTPEFSVDGNLLANIDTLARHATASAWSLTDISDLRAGLRHKVSLTGNNHTADSIIDALSKLAPVDARLAVDAGAHMFSTMARWPATQPHAVLKSNGLSTMGFALPAAIASYLTDPSHPVIAITGDGGLLMCLAELSTAARLNIPVTVIVLNDAALSLIDIKQQQLQHPVSGVRYPAVDFAMAARSMGCQAWSVGADEPLEEVLSLALSTTGPSVVDVTTDPAGYRDQLAALRK
jgi:acetolactate synthase-1/2/3 large subunit